MVTRKVNERYDGHQRISTKCPQSTKNSVKTAGGVRKSDGGHACCNIAYDLSYMHECPSVMT